jgi:hypothetical protein
MKLAPALVPLEVWFWYMLFLDLLSAKSTIQRFFSSNLPSENSYNFLNIASKLTNEVPFERRKIYLSPDYNMMIIQQLHN